MPYRIKPGYTPRLDNDYDPEIGIEDRYQDEVYRAALELARDEHLLSVLDVGTGRAFKLLKYFKHYETLGVDLPPTVDWLREVYPDREWQYMAHDNAPQGFELVICADVIEHVTDPDALCDYINRAAPRFAVISTPDRELLRYKGSFDGPPSNTCHVREWTFAEFDLYMRDHFEIVSHFYANPAQVCQAVIVKPYDASP